MDSVSDRREHTLETSVWKWHELFPRTAWCQDVTLSLTLSLTLFLSLPLLFSLAPSRCYERFVDSQFVPKPNQEVNECTLVLANVLVWSPQYHLPTCKCIWVQQTCKDRTPRRTCWQSGSEQRWVGEMGERRESYFLIRSKLSSPGGEQKKNNFKK